MLPKSFLLSLDDGTVWCWGKNKKGQLGIPGLTDKKLTKPTQGQLPTIHSAQFAA